MIKEPLEIDFYVDSRPMTEADKKAINDYIKAEKAKVLKKSGRKFSSQKSDRKRVAYNL